MPVFKSRERAAEAFALRASHYSWREVCEHLGYRSVGAAQSAVKRHVERNKRGESTPVRIEAHRYAIETRTRALTQRFTSAFMDGDDGNLVLLNREIRSNEIELAKIGGLYEPATVNVNVQQKSVVEIIAETRERLRASIDGEVVGTRELMA